MHKFEVVMTKAISNLKKVLDLYKRLIGQSYESWPPTRGTHYMYDCQTK